jgi:uncharacterized protein (DUF2384 family)
MGKVKDYRSGFKEWLSKPRTEDSNVSENIQEDFRKIRERLSVYYKRHEIDLWLRSPHAMLGGRRACDLLNAGQVSEVDRVIDQLDAGVYL